MADRLEEPKRVISPSTPLRMHTVRDSKARSLGGVEGKHRGKPLHRLKSKFILFFESKKGPKSIFADNGKKVA